MTDLTTAKTAMYNQGKSDALDLRTRAPEMDGTGLIAEEQKIPAFDPQKDYLGWVKGTPVTDEGQVWTLLIPHNAAAYPGLRPATNRACWGLAHTTDPAKAKPWVDAYGTSGMYMTRECYRAEDGTVYRALMDDLVYPADVLPGAWEAVYPS